MWAKKTHSEKESQMPSLRWPLKAYLQPIDRWSYTSTQVCILREQVEFCLFENNDQTQYCSDKFWWRRQKGVKSETVGVWTWAKHITWVHEILQGIKMSSSLCESVQPVINLGIFTKFFLCLFFLLLVQVSVSFFSPHIEELFIIMFEINIIILFSCSLSYPSSSYIILLALFQIIFFVFISS